MKKIVKAAIITGTILVVGGGTLYVVNKKTDGAVMDFFHGVKEKFGGRAQAAAETVTEAAQTAAETVRDTIEDVADTIGDVTI